MRETPPAPAVPGPAPHTAVLVVGAGPAGLTVACELALAGVPVTVLERDAAPPPFCRGFNLNARSLELLDRRGLVDRFLAEGPTVSSTMFVGGARLDLAAMDCRHPYVLGIPQTRVEELLAARAAELGVRILRGHRVTGLRQDADGVTVETAAPDGPATWRCRYLAGCDGGRSTVRRLTGIAFPGTPSRRFTLLGDVLLADGADLPFGVTTGPGGAVFAVPRPGYVRLITADPEPPADRDDPVTLPRFQAAVDRALGRPAPIAEARWLTRFGDAARLAERLRQGRVFLAGDAAHIHPPAGAIGVNAAIDDATALGWRLALAARGLADDAVLDAYHDERHAAGARLIRDTRAQAVLGRDDEELGPVRELLAELATVPATAGPLAETITAVNTRYPVRHPSGHAWDGRAVPDVPAAPAGLFDLLARTGRGVLLLAPGALAEPLREAAAGWSDRVTAAATAPGALPGATAVLVRPDGHAAWIAPAPQLPDTAAGSASEALRATLTADFGPPTEPSEPSGEET